MGEMGRFAVAAELGILLPYLVLAPLVSSEPVHLGLYLRFDRLVVLGVAWIALVIGFAVINEEAEAEGVES